MKGYRNTAIWFTDGTSEWPFYTNLTHDELREKMEAETGKTVLQIQDRPEWRRGGRGNQYKCEGAMDFNPEIEYICTNYHPEKWVSIIKKAQQPFQL